MTRAVAPLSRRSVVAGGALALLGCGQREVTGGFAGASPERGHLLREAPGAAPGTTRRTRVVIAGAGIAGLAAARALRRRGIEDFVLLELEDAAGGNSRAGSVDGIACPLGAHYLPVPGDDARDVQDFLEELGLRKRVAGRWTYEERHLCHAPQERLFFRGQWQDGLLPLQGVDAATLGEYGRFARRVYDAGRAARFTIPAPRAPSPSHRALDAIRFDRWLASEGLASEHLLWYLDYCCRDDYGAGIASVSAWAGIHYFASRHGFQLPGAEGSERDAVLTWPEGNGWLVRALRQPLGDRVSSARVVTCIVEGRHSVQVDALNAVTRETERWQAAHCIVALPVFAAARVLENPPALLAQRAAATRHAPWLVANMHLGEPLADRGGAAPAWDNVVYDATGLGYVDAGHQSLDPRPGPTVLSWYHAPGEAARKQALEQGWQHWHAAALADLSAAHPDLAGKIARVEVARYGHAMAIPVPGALAQVAAGTPRTARLSFAHADWAGYSIFEEAFTAGHRAGLAAG